jgi:hypothetical protein
MRTVEVLRYEVRSLALPAPARRASASQTLPVPVFDTNNHRSHRSNTNKTGTMASTFLFTSESVNEGHPGEYRERVDLHRKKIQTKQVDL